MINLKIEPKDEKKLKKLQSYLSKAYQTVRFNNSPNRMRFKDKLSSVKTSEKELSELFELVPHMDEINENLGGAYKMELPIVFNQNSLRYGGAMILRKEDSETFPEGTEKFYTDTPLPADFFLL